MTIPELCEKKFMSGEGMIPADDIKNMMHEFDLIDKTLLIVCNPFREQEVEEALGDGYAYYSHWIVPFDVVYCVDRKELESVMECF